MLELVLAGLFSDHAVLQRDQANPVWGRDRAGQTVTLVVEGPAAAAHAAAPVTATVTTTAAADGSWTLSCPPLPAGGPYTFHVRGSGERTVADVWSGEVWLASGQSNMEWRVGTSNDAEREVAAAQFPQIRMLKVPLTAADAPARDVAASWSVCTPENAGDFSAVGYFFARELHRKLGVPVGIINSTWGGTRVEAWTSLDGLRRVMDVEAELAARNLPPAELARVKAEYAAKLLAWETANFPRDTGNAGETNGWARADFSDAAWRTLTVPGFWLADDLHIDGAVWLRREFDVPAAWAGRELVLNLGAIDDFDATYLNGRLVGAMPQGTPAAYQLVRRYTVPAAQVKAGRNVLAVRVFDQFGDGGFAGPTPAVFAECPSLGGARVSLAGTWRYAVERAIPPVGGQVFATYPGPPAALQTQNAAAALYHGMIAPLVPYGLRGAIWYQGEANVGNAAQYRDRFTTMIRDWRTRWGQGQFPFYFVQLADFREGGTWPWLREAQTQTLAEPATGMVVTLDIGNPADIHPRNKQEVGRRLALLALARTYGVARIEDSGPTLQRVAIEGAIARVLWNHAAGLRTRDGAADVKGFELAGADGAFHPAEATIEGESVRVTSAAVPAPRAVRYAWADAPATNLCNAAGLPAAPFRTD